MIIRRREQAAAESNAFDAELVQVSSYRMRIKVEWK